MKARGILFPLATAVATISPGCIFSPPTPTTAGTPHPGHDLESIDFFDHWGVEPAKVLAERIIPELSGDNDPAAHHDSSTANLIPGGIANTRVRRKRNWVTIPPLRCHSLTVAVRKRCYSTARVSKRQRKALFGSLLSDVQGARLRGHQRCFRPGFPIDFVV